MAENSHHQLVLVERDGRLMRLRDVVLDAPEDEGLERRVAGVVGLDKQPQNLPLLALISSASTLEISLQDPGVADRARERDSKREKERKRRKCCTCRPTMPPASLSARAVITSRTRSCTCTPLAPLPDSRLALSSDASHFRTLRCALDATLRWRQEGGIALTVTCVLKEKRSLYRVF